jgi:hypothetical protein
VRFEEHPSQTNESDEGLSSSTLTCQANGFREVVLIEHSDEQWMTQYMESEGIEQYIMLLLSAHEI